MVSTATPRVEQTRTVYAGIATRGIALTIDAGLANLIVLIIGARNMPPRERMGRKATSSMSMPSPAVPMSAATSAVVAPIPVQRTTARRAS